jgi:hypothetical protein
MRSSSQSKKLGTLVVLMGSLVAGLLSAAHADENQQKGFGGFFRHLFTNSVSTNSTSSNVAPPTLLTNTPSLIVQPAAPSQVQEEAIVSTPSLNNAFSSEAMTSSAYSLPATKSLSVTTNSCIVLRDGESKVVNSGNIPNDMKALVANYMISRAKDPKSGETVYTAGLNIKFTPKTNEDPSVINTIIERTKACYAAADFVSAQGEHLHLRLAQANEGIPVTNVTVNSAPAVRMVAEDAFNWSTQAPCSTTLHESMHLLGLVDLYSEKAQSGSSMWDCRSTADDSLMNNLNFGKYAAGLYEEHQCGCDTSACARILDRIHTVPASCPTGTDASEFQLGDSQLDVESDPAVKASFDANYGALLNGKRVDQWTYEFVIPERVNKQILYPAEFRAITQPGCSSNTLYYQCSKNAYLTSTNSGGSGCVAAPSVCDSPGAWLQ